MNWKEILNNIRPALPHEGLPLPYGIEKNDPFNPVKLIRNGKEGLENAMKCRGDIQSRFTCIIDAIAPRAPDFDSLPELSHKANQILAPMLFNKFLPPAPRGLVNLVGKK
ncbi:MAG: hypothetical protein PHU23_05995 [Dehalococcoidales bacterium]|nr:hypothetical protein [Dehalococcoidales bacterium]